ncbi:ParB/RepB/Spo0J family partition protein [Pseudonocardia sp. T1-2H]|uniref:ParB/RepB/Spo0J family partition protein n=1 Tax=Pseudonocardia sp. T1-2H TaxID=3128899 RepID=UPI0031011568
MASTTEDLDTYVETRSIPIGELHQFPGNARRGNVAELRKSLKRHGQYRAIIVQDRGPDGFRVLAGNHTFQALEAEGRTEVRCEVHRMDDDLARRVNVADNRQGELGHNDQDALVELLSYFEGDYEGVGYSDADVQRMLEPPMPPPEDDNPGGSRGLGEAVVAYNIVFDNEVQQSRWYEFMRWLRREYPDMETIGERLHAYLGALDLG